jgi:plasmid stabilization system protein ParE
MAHQIIWTAQAQEDYRHIQDYLLDNWPHPVAKRFASEVLSKLDILETMPYFGKQIEGRLNSVRTVLVKPYHEVYYAIAGQFVVILNIMDTRRSNR